MARFEKQVRVLFPSAFHYNEWEDFRMMDFSLASNHIPLTSLEELKKLLGTANIDISIGGDLFLKVKCLEVTYPQTSGSYKGEF